MNADNTSNAPDFFRDRGFGGGMGFGKRPALVIVDFMNGFTDTNYPLGASCDAQIQETNKLLDAAHAAHVPAIFSIIQYDDEKMSDAGLWIKKIGGLNSLMANSEAVQLDSRLHKTADDTILIKKYASCFFGTDLASRLHAKGIDTVLIMGATTSGCVRATAVDSCQNGFKTIVVKDASADRSQVAHDQALVDVETKYGDVVTTHDGVAYLKSIPATV